MKWLKGLYLEQLTSFTVKGRWWVSDNQEASTWYGLFYTVNYKFILFCWRRQRHPTAVLLPGKSHGWRSLVGWSPWVAKSRTWLSDFTFTFHFHSLKKEMATHSSVLAWRIPGMGEPGGLLSMGSHRVGHDWSDAAAAARVPYVLWKWTLIRYMSCRYFLLFCNLPFHSIDCFFWCAGAFGFSVV